MIFNWCSVNKWKSQATATLGIRWQKQRSAGEEELTALEFLVIKPRPSPTPAARPWPLEAGARPASCSAEPPGPEQSLTHIRDLFKECVELDTLWSGVNLHKRKGRHREAR